MKAILPLALLLVAACSSMEWRKDGVSAEASLSEWADCRRYAELRVPPEFPLGPFGPIVGPAGVIAYPAPVSPSHREADVLGMAQTCMHDKGYKLMPVGK